MRLINLLTRNAVPAPETQVNAGIDVTSLPNLEERATRITGLTEILSGNVGVENVEWWGERGGLLTTSAIVRRCINAIAQPLASLEMVVLNPDGEEQMHPFATVFNKGSGTQPMSARVVKEVAFSRLEWRGQAFLFMDRGESGTGEVQSVTPIYRTVKPVIDRDARGIETLLGYRVKSPVGGWIGLLPKEVLWLRYPDPDDPWGCVAPWKAAKMAAELDALSQGWQASELKNGNKASAVVYLGDLTEPEHAAAVAQWRRTMTGPQSANRTFLTSGPTKSTVDRLGLTPREVAYLDSRQLNMEEVALAFGIDRDFVFGQSTFENKAAAKRALWTDTLIPKLEVVSSEVDRQVLPEPNLEASWDVSNIEALQENESAKVERIGVLLTNDAITIDEARVDRGLEPLPGGLGALTLTAYRQAVAAGNAPAVDPASDPAEGRSLARQRVYVGRRGVRTHQPRSGRPAAVQQRARAADRDEATVLRVYDRLEARGAKAIRRFAEKQERAVLRNFTKAATRNSRENVEVRVEVGEFFDEHYWQGQTRDALESFMTDVWDEGGHRTASHLGLSFEQYDARVTDQMNRRLDVLAEQVTATTRAAIESGVLTDAAEQGLSVPQTAELLRLHFTDLRSWRADAIARTETVGGFNGASRQVALTSGVVQARQWLATNDGRTRDSHAALNGRMTSGLDDPYPNGLMYPGDPTGPARETVNCRCVELYVMED